VTNSHMKAEKFSLLLFCSDFWIFFSPI